MGGLPSSFSHSHLFHSLFSSQQMLAEGLVGAKHSASWETEVNRIIPECASN